MAIIKNKLERKSAETFLPPSVMPTGSLRETMISRARTLKASLHPAGTEAVKPEIVAIFATMACRAGDATDAAIVQRIYAEDLAEAPLFAVRQACSDFRQKRAGDGRWAPSQGDIRERALRIAKPFADELSDLLSILRAKPLALDAPKPMTDEERAARQTRVRGIIDKTLAKNVVSKNERAILDAGGILDDLGMHKRAPDKRDRAADPEETRRAADANLDRMRDDGWVPKASDALLSRMAR